MNYERLIILVKKLKYDTNKYFGEFYELTKRQVFYAALTIVKDSYIAEDIMQETYLKFLQKIDTIKEDKTILAYLIRVSKNLSINYVNKNKKTILVDDERQFDRFAEEDESYSSTLKIMQQELNETEYDIVVYHVLLEMTHKQIAKELNKPIGTITWAYNNAINKLRRVIKDD